MGSLCVPLTVVPALERLVIPAPADSPERLAHGCEGLPFEPIPRRDEQPPQRLEEAVGGGRVVALGGRGQIHRELVHAHAHRRQVPKVGGRDEAHLRGQKACVAGPHTASG